MGKLLEMEDVEVGLAVVLLEPDEDYEIGEVNPAVGTKFECPGVITGFNHDEILVTWNNGCTNVYKDGELSLHNPEPNRIISIWEN